MIVYQVFGGIDQMHRIVVTTLALAVSLATQVSAGENPMLLMKTSKGEVKIELFKDKAPGTTENFLSYVKSGHYDGTIFHRVIPDFMVQGGGFDADFKEKKTGAAIQNEATNGVKNQRGTLAMARTQAPHSATAQFFINTVDNAFLDHKDKGAGFGYAVFGKVSEGMDVIDSIQKVKTGSKGLHNDVPVEPVVIESISVVE